MLIASITSTSETSIYFESTRPNIAETVTFIVIRSGTELEATELVQKLNVAIKLFMTVLTEAHC
jgi:hypothetical protein